MQEQEADKKLAEFSDIRLSWVQRFRWVAELGNLVAASEKCHVSATEVSESIQALSAALCRPLVIPTTARLFVMGEHFVPIANKVLELAGNANRPLNNVTVASLQSLIAVQKEASYSAAARSLGRTRFKVMRDIKALTHWVREPVVYLSGEVRLTERGADLARRSHEIVALLERSIGRDKNPEHWRKKPRVMPLLLRAYGTASRGRRHAKRV
jgi:DNA-binding transcriptional LysR family regulator